MPLGENLGSKGGRVPLTHGGGGPRKYGGPDPGGGRKYRGLMDLGGKWPLDIGGKLATGDSMEREK